MREELISARVDAAAQRRITPLLPRYAARHAGWPACDGLLLHRAPASCLAEALRDAGATGGIAAITLS